MAGQDAATRLATLAMLEPGAREQALAALSPAQKRELVERWELWAHDGQVAPPGDWRVWLIRAGRGFGKTRAGAEWVSALAREQPGARIALMGATLRDVERVMVRGESGLLAVARKGETPKWIGSLGQVHFASGAIGFAYSAAAPEALRGPQHHAAWCDELGKWKGEAGWDNLMMTLRLGERPRVLVTTTPRATPLMRKVMALPDCVETIGRTSDNAHLPDSFQDAMLAQYGDTRLGRQELDGEMVDDREGALWTRALLDRQRAKTVPALDRVVVGVDPPATSSGDACGIVAVGLGRDGHGYVREDASEAGLSPEGWAARVAGCARRNRADRVVAERNQGGDMVESVLRLADPALPVHLVYASIGKAARAEPVSFLYAQGRVWHSRGFPALEDELCGLGVAGAYDGPGRSPDRADALVWALTELMLSGRGAPGIRNL